jgi:hypothetical protein
MAKRQKHSNREIRKPKKLKETAVTSVLSGKNLPALIGNMKKKN